jgi:hypothetical protein
MSTRDDRHLAHYDRYVRQSVEKLVSTDVTVIEVEEPKSRIGRLEYVPGGSGYCGGGTPTHSAASTSARYYCAF